MDILNLRSLETTEAQELDTVFRIFAKTKSPPKCCQKCGSMRENNLSRFGKKTQAFMDIPLRGKRTCVFVDRQRFICRDCDSTFFEELPDMDDRHSATKRLIGFIQQQSLLRTFTSLAEDIGVHEKTIRNIFSAYAQRLNQSYKPTIPNWIGIDEIHLIKSPRCVITNIENNSLIDMLPGRTKAEVREWFLKLPYKRHVEYVTMDMWRPYRDVCRELLPSAKVIVDKFHVVRMANDALDTIRKQVRTNLTSRSRVDLLHDRYTLLKRKRDLSPREIEVMDSWVDHYPDLYNAYMLKELFYTIFESPDKQTALEQFQEWKSLITEDVAHAFSPLARTFENWREEITNYFEMPLTNAYTESFNNLIRTTNRMGRGYSFEVIRVKMLFGKDAKRKNLEPVKPKKTDKELNLIELPIEMVSDYFQHMGRISRLKKAD